jgi:hypothetical protein
VLADSSDECWSITAARVLLWPHAVHQLSQARARISGQGVSGMAQVVEMNTGQASFGDGGQSRAAVEVAMSQRCARRGW